jgi:arylsulfatase A-like enzyme
MKPKYFILGLLAFFFTFSCTGRQRPAEPAASENRPNIVLILADDMGYGDIQKYNPDSRIPTPNLNAMAERGMRFIDAHTNSAVCTPSRYGILTGRYAWRTRLQKGVLKEPDNNEPLIARDQLTLAGMLKKHNYHTACIGKWHLGIEWAKNENGESDYNLPFLSGPNEVGFDYFFGINAALDMTPYGLYRNHDPIQPLDEHQTALTFPKFIREGPRAKDFQHSEVLDILTEEAVDYIAGQAKSSDPFFLYFALTSPHKPVWPAERFQGSTTLGPYADFIVQTDWTVGQVLRALKENDLVENTLVIFTSDNGSFMFRVNADESYPFGQEIPSQSFYARKVGSGLQDHTDNNTVHGYYPYVHTANSTWRGTKADIWEGGHRVPFIVRWPGHVEAETESGQAICITDLIATVADITGYSLNGREGEDSFSFLPVLTGEVSQLSRTPIVLHSGNGTFAIRQNNWKMVFSNGSGGREVPVGNPFEEPYSLFDLEFDPSETTNVIDEYPDVAKSLTDELNAIRRNRNSNL